MISSSTMAPKSSSKNKNLPESSSKRKASVEGSSKGKAPAEPSRKGKEPVAGFSELRSNKSSRVFLGDFVFYSDPCRQNYNQLTMVKGMVGVRPVNLDAFGDMPLHPIFHFQRLDEFLTPEYVDFYPITVCEFYTNLRRIDSENDNI